MRRLFWILFVLAIVARILFATEFASKELGLERYPLREMRHFTMAAKRITEGDLVMRGSLEDYDLLIDMMGRDRFFEWGGEVPLAISPLYPYLLAGTHAVTGSGEAARWLQVALTLLTALLVWHLARVTTRNEGVATLAFALYAFHPTSIFYAGFLLRETLFTALLLAFVVLLVRQHRRPAWTVALSLGVVLGVLHLCRSSLFLCLPPTLLVLFLARPSWRERRWDAMALAAAFLLVVTPLMIRNVVCGSALLHNDAFGPLSLVMGNHPWSDGLHEVWPPNDYVHSVLKDSGPGLVSILIHTVDRFPSLGAFLLLVGKKLWGFWNGYEAWNILRFHTYEPIIDALRCFPFKSLIVLPLALLGALASPRSWRRLWPLYLGLFLILAPCLAIASTARYRLPAFPYLAVFAALGLQVIRHGTARRRAGVLGVLVMCALVAYPVGPTRVEPFRAHASLGNLYQGTGQVRRAKVHFLNAVRIHPLSSEPPLGLKTLPNTPLWKEYLELHQKANALCLLDGDEEGVKRVRRSLERHFATPSR